jgi:hypothetical protein
VKKLNFFTNKKIKTKDLIFLRSFIYFRKLKKAKFKYNSKIIFLISGNKQIR